MNNTKRVIVGIAIAGTAFGLTACNTGSSSSVRNDQAATDSQLDRYQKNQPIPAFSFSQERETLISLLTARADTVATTSFFYNMGSNIPIDSCPSIGFPIPTTAQLTNPKQITYGAHPGGGSDPEVVDQSEPTGVYTGESSGTYVVCVSPKGEKFVEYWEGAVNAIGGPAHFDPKTEQVELDGTPTVQVKTK